jgi:poly(hydroxyalkanoate) depolymerase family esterase
MKYFLPDAVRQITRLTQGGRRTDLSPAMQRFLDAAKPTTGLRSTHLPYPIGFEIGDHEKPGFSNPIAGTPEHSEGAPVGARFLAKTFSDQTGSRPYKLYVPSGYRARPLPLVVMLHGCTQSPDDFATGTRMNVAAEARTCLVAYPGQTSAANMQKCWNWFKHGDQQRDEGEPSLIAGITRQIARDYAVDPTRIYIAGLSAGGAAAAIMGDVYPELYAAIGVHSGLACGAARDMRSAFTAMQGGADGRERHDGKRMMPTIVFHGERDTTVHPRNGDAVINQVAKSLRTRVEAGRVPGGHAYSRTLHFSHDGSVVAEKWVVHGAGHAWSGGDPAGSYTDLRGPDATGEMMRFFLAHTLG